MEALKKLIEDKGWKPIEGLGTDVDSALVTDGKVTAFAVPPETKTDEEKGLWAYHEYPDTYNLCAMKPTHFMPLDTHERMAGIIAILVAAIRSSKNSANYILANFMDIDGLPVGHIGSIEDNADEALEIANQIASQE